MKPLQVNPQTGFLESRNVTITQYRNAFDSNRKLQFLKIAKDYIEEHNQFPSIHAICKAVDVSISTFEDHLKADDAFKHAWNEVKSILKSVYTNKLAVKADSKNGIVANLAILKYLETGSFVDRLQVNSVDNIGTSKRINEALIIDIDPEIQENTGKLESTSGSS